MMRWLTPRRVLLAGWIVFLLYAWPGHVDVESADMIVEARLGRFTDWHSPIMARVFWLLSHVLAGAPGMLLLQSGLFLAGAYHLARRVVSDRAAAGVTVGVLLFPPILAIEAAVSPQSLFAGLALAGTALLTSVRPRRKLGGLALLLVAAGLHAGATIAVLPLVLFGLRWREDMRHVRRFAIASIAWVAIALGAYALERSIIDDVSRRPDVALGMHDLRGIQYQTRSADPTLAALTQLTDARDVNRTAIIDGRRTYIRSHLGGYIKHRLRHLRLMLRSESKLFVSFVQEPGHANVLSHRARHSLVQRALIGPVEKLSHTPLFQPQLYAFLAIGLLVFAILRRYTMVSALLASGLACEVTTAFFALSTESRLSHWMVTASMLGAALFFVQLRRAHPPDDHGR